MHVVQYSIVLYCKIDPKMIVFRISTIQNVTKRSPLFIYGPCCLTHMVCAVFHCFPKNFKVKSKDGYKHMALDSNHISAFGEEEKKPLTAVQDWNTIHVRRRGNAMTTELSVPS